MRTIRLMVLVMASCLVTSAQGVPSPFIPPPPGPLETFLADNPNASVVKKQTGMLIGTNNTKAIFTAIVASLPGDPSATFRGLQIQLEQGSTTYPLYFDYEPAVPPETKDNFQRLLDKLADAAGKNGRMSSVKEQLRPGVTRWGMSAEGSVQNHAVLNIGYWHGERDTGVTIWDAHRDREIYLAGAAVEQAIAYVKAAREFLVAN